jgi:hypothetical protein
MLLGCAGLIPFFLAGGALWAGPQRLGPAVFHAPVALLGYGATIVAFLGGVRWGAEMQRPGGPRGLVMALATLPQVLAWLLIVAPVPTVARYGGLMLLVAVAAVADATSAELPDWYRRIRIPLGVGAAIALGSGLAWTIVLANSMGRHAGG